MRLPIFNKIKRCANCSTPIFMERFDDQDRIVRIMKKDGICYDCAYWSNLAKYPPENLEVLNGEAILAYPKEAMKSDRTVRLGGGGSTHYFLRNDRSLLESNDIWKYGKIPETFRNLFPDSMVEISKMAYARLKRNPVRCYARGCLDRYHCLRYDISDELELGAYNTVPKNWIPGSEECKQFVNKSIKSPYGQENE